jgi:copper chaperone CopZ
MACKQCEVSISNAIKAVDAQATISIDLSNHLLTIRSSHNAATLENVIREAGYSPVLLAAE